MTKNRHQESLNWLVECIQKEIRSADSIKKLFVTEMAWEHSEVIQELIDKEIPTEPVIKLGSITCGAGCGRYFVHENVRCDRCGTKIKWSDEE